MCCILYFYSTSNVLYLNSSVLGMFVALKLDNEKSLEKGKRFAPINNFLKNKRV